MSLCTTCKYCPVELGNVKAAIRGGRIEDLPWEALNEAVLNPAKYNLNYREVYILVCKLSEIAKVANEATTKPETETASQKKVNAELRKEIKLLKSEIQTLKERMDSMRITFGEEVDD